MDDDSGCRDILVNTLFTDSVSQIEIRRAICIVIHRLEAKRGDIYSRHLLFLLGSIMKQALAVLPSKDTDKLKEYLFLQSQFITRIASSENLTGTLFEGD
jgi:hypothetical protein